MNKKKSFLIHIDSLDVLDDLTDEQCGQLFKSIKSYHLDGDINLSSIVKVAFSPFKNQFIRDNEKYQKTCKARADAGSKGGKQKVANVAIASKSKQKVANVAENKNKTKNDNENDSKDIKKTDFSCFDNFTYEQIKELKRIRKKNKGGSISQRVANSLSKEFKQSETSGFSIEQCLTEWEVRGWKSFKAEWMKSNNFNQSNQPDFSDDSTDWVHQDHGLI